MDNSRLSEQGTRCLAQPIDQLTLVMADVESFLEDWLRRLDQLHAIAPSPDAVLRGRIREFELDRSQWEAKRNRETQDIHEKAAELTNAWLRLEEEQRSFLRSRDSKPHLGRTNTADAVSHDADRSNHEPVTETAPADESVSTDHRTPATAERRTAVVQDPQEEPITRRTSPLQGQRARAPAVRQFEQLRREIQTIRHQA